jgi:membrane associated rhomboid family serine protease
MSGVDAARFDSFTPTAHPLPARKFAIIYISASIFSMVTSALTTPQSVTVGASGALFGLFGAYLAELITNCHLLSFRDGFCAFMSLGFSIAINLAIGLLPVRVCGGEGGACEWLC